MKRILLPLACVLALWPSPARAGISLHIELGLPVAPPLVEVQPGIQVVEGFPEEVFFSGGWYWCRRPDGWYRTRSPRDRFDWVDRRFVPRGLARFPAGRYRNWHRAEPRRGPERRMEGPGRRREGPGFRHDMRRPGERP